jgi:hypothetical protein
MRTATTREDPKADARIQAAAHKLLETHTREELLHVISKIHNARGPRFMKHPKREGDVAFRGTLEEHQASLIEATGCSDLETADWLLREVASTFLDTMSAWQRLDAAGGMLAALAPKSPLEGLLCSQMVAVHGLAMRLISIGAAPEIRFVHLTPALVGANKLLRTFTMQVEALQRLRTAGVTEQRVVVQHVTVADGGQAVIGAVTRAGGEEGGR